MPKKRSIGTKAAYALFIEDRRARGYTEPTVRFYRDKLGLFIRWCDAQGITSLDELTPVLMRRYFVALIDKGNAQATQNGAGRGVRAFLKWCMAEGLLAVYPLANVSIPKPPKDVLPAFTENEVRKMLAIAPDARARALVLFLLDTGVRVTELVNLNAEHVNLSTGEVIVRKGKGRKDRTVYTSGKTRRALIAYFGADGWPESSEPVWRNERTGERLTDNGIRQILRPLGHDAGIKQCNPHRFRRTFALWSLRAGMNIYTLARLMGHGDITVLKHYLALVEGDIADAHRRAGIIENFLK